MQQLARFQMTYCVSRGSPATAELLLH